MWDPGSERKNPSVLSCGQKTAVFFVVIESNVVGCGFTLCATPHVEDSVDFSIRSGFVMHPLHFTIDRESQSRWFGLRELGAEDGPLRKAGRA